MAETMTNAEFLAMVFVSANTTTNFRKERIYCVVVSGQLENGVQAFRLAPIGKPEGLDSNIILTTTPHNSFVSQIRCCVLGPNKDQGRIFLVLPESTLLGLNTKRRWLFTIAFLIYCYFIA
ncbi:hypothetical protein QUF63_15630 [Anaerolineales bacterium HSG25]|nr:hypothetical protein [Anaerolineales bacterium HSG25]